MRFVVAPYTLLATWVFLIAVPKESWANPLAGVSFAALKPIMENYLISLQLKGNAEEVEVRAWMHVGNPNQSGCGLYLRATGHSGNFARSWFPEPKEHRCGEYRPYMRITSPSAMYSTRVRLGNDQTYKVQVHADGWMDTHVRTMCFGFNERTIMGGPRAFCIDNNILKACKKLNNEYKDIDLETDNIRLTRTVRGIHQIVFIDVESVIESFETLAEHPDDQTTLLKICRKMILWRGVDGKDLKGCPFIRRWWASHEDDQNPYGCDR